MDGDFGNFWPQTSREIYLHQYCLYLEGCYEGWRDERDKLLEKISVRDEIMEAMKCKNKEEIENLWDENDNLKNNVIFGMQMDSQDKNKEILHFKKLNFEHLEVLANKEKEKEIAENDAKLWKKLYEDIVWEESKRKSNDLSNMEKKVNEMQEQFNVKMKNKEDEFKEQLSVWKDEETCLLTQINKLSSEYKKLLTIISKNKEENGNIILEKASLKFQLEKLEQVCMNTKIQAEHKMNEFESNYSEEINKLQLGLKSIGSKISTISKENDDLIQDKIVMQKQIDELRLQVVILIQKISTISCERDNLIINNGTFKNKNLMQKKILEEHVQSNNKKIYEANAIITSLSNNVNFLKQEVINLKTVLSNAKVDINAIQLVTHNNLQQYELQNLIMSSKLIVIFQKAHLNAYENENEMRVKSTIKQIEPKCNVESNHEKKLACKEHSNVIEKVQNLEKNKKIVNSNFDLKNENLEMNIVIRQIKINIVILNWKNKNKKQSHIKNEKDETYSTMNINFAIVTIKKYIQRNDDFYVKHENDRDGTCGFLILKLWVNDLNSKYTNTIVITNTCKNKNSSKKLHIICVVINDLNYNIDQNTNFYNKHCIWDYEINPYIWNPGIWRIQSFN
jgi:hypothetical protein